MKINLLEMASGYLSDTVINKLSSSVGIDKSTAESGIEKIFPALLGSIGERAEDPVGAKDVFKAVEDTDSGLLDNLTGFFDGDNSGIITKGKDMLLSLLGDKFDSLSDLLGFIPGLSKEKAGGLMGMLTPLLTGMLGKTLKPEGPGGASLTGLTGLTSLLGDQKEFVAESLGGEYAEKLGLGSFLASTPTMMQAAGDLACDAKDSVTGAACSVKDAAAGAVDSAKDVACDAGDAVKGLAAGATGAVAGALGSAKDAACDAGSAAKDMAADTACSIKDAAAGAVDSAKDVACDAGDAVKGLAAGATGAAAGALGSAKDLASGAVDSAKDVASDAGDTVKGLAAGATGAAAGAASSVKDVAGSAVSSVSDTVEKSGGGLMKLIPIALLALLAFFGWQKCSKKETPSIDSVKDAAAGTLDKASNLASDAGSAVSDAVDGATDLASDAGSAVSGAVGSAVDGATDLASDAGSAVSGAVGNAVDGASDLANDAGSAVGGAVDSTVDGASDLAEGVADAATTTFSFTPASEDGTASEALSDNVMGLAKRLQAAGTATPEELGNIYTEIMQENKYTFMYRIPFATGETGVPAAHQEPLVTKLKEAPAGTTLVTIGYADTRGDDALNNRLSYGRAQEVGGWIKTTLGGDNAMEAFSMGETDRFSKDDYSQNRVVEVWGVSE